jgi:hypothetical protein
MPQGYLQTGQSSCYNTAGNIIACSGTGQDGELRRGIPLPEPRFETSDQLVHDPLTGLTWTRNANLAEFPLSWQEAHAFIARLNEENRFGHADWRLPTRRELRSLLHFETRKPALPPAHPFVNVFLHWYWTSTTAAIHPDYAWYVHLEGARMFYGHKEQFYLLWPVRGASTMLPATGQSGETHPGPEWPEPRFESGGETVLDRLTLLRWQRQADLSREPVSWAAALELIDKLNDSAATTWRLPNINELESLTDCSRYAPALPADHPFTGVRDGYWSSTTSYFEPDWAWVLYLDKGATGVGIKSGATFFVWPVADS